MLKKLFNKLFKSKSIEWRNIWIAESEESHWEFLTFDNGEVELRLSTMPTAFGEKVVMRIFDPEILLKNFYKLRLVV